ncbi:hypothetical protein OE88DRAFT_1690849 [Heliocybe sulcata]|uniref:C3H1-type domain-containing protein n=1 Tax=Heliocybe sulcata TaxID=5364 RepID=A0A5C3NIQ7_9AGAM|nr:hypothetical protein OE88DRAFT_1690849 [Heliocybe sulcata]
MEEENADLGLWERLLGEQTALFRKTTSENVELKARVVELEREVSVWKLAHKTGDEERNVMKQSMSRLERNIGSLKDDNPLITCLIDGDGHIFSQELLTKGQNGGRQAAMLLTKGIITYMADHGGATTGRSQLWLTIYCNKSGLLETLMNHHICTAEQFESFMLGFNQSSPLFCMVDVGSGKEAADAKIKECLRLFARWPQTSRVFFGGMYNLLKVHGRAADLSDAGGHDNGYTSTLNHLQNEGLFEKIVLLRGYKDIAWELRSLNLPDLEINGVFMPRKLSNYPHKKTPTPPSTIKADDFEKFRASPRTPSSSLTMSPKQTNKSLMNRYPDPNLPINKQKPPPCNFYYLAECKSGDRCRYGHDYILTKQQLDEIRYNSKKSPCPMINKDHVCPKGDSCCMGHYCPRGPKCTFLKQGKCKFIGRDMHQQMPSSTASLDLKGKSRDTTVETNEGTHMSPLSSSILLSPVAEPYTPMSPSKYSSHAAFINPSNMEYPMYPQY